MAVSPRSRKSRDSYCGYADLFIFMQDERNAAALRGPSRPRDRRERVQDAWFQASMPAANGSFSYLGRHLKCFSIESAPERLCLLIDGRGRHFGQPNPPRGNRPSKPTEGKSAEQTQRGGGHPPLALRYFFFFR
jgi:hypothetical protein